MGIVVVVAIVFVAIETQLETIRQIGLENYLSEQIKKEGSYAT